MNFKKRRTRSNISEVSTVLGNKKNHSQLKSYWGNNGFLKKENCQILTEEMKKSMNKLR